MMTDSLADIVWQASYLPFGEVDTITGPAALDYRFPGQWFQLETGLAYNWHRHYDPTTGRFLQPDPLGMPDGPSRWAYVGNSPLSVDPRGLQAGPYAPPPSNVPGGPWRWAPNPQNSRGGEYVGPGGSASWDPEGHWDCTDRQGNRQRYDWRGNPITTDQAHKPPKWTPRLPPWFPMIIITPGGFSCPPGQSCPTDSRT